MQTIVKQFSFIVHVKFILGFKCNNFVNILLFLSQILKKIKGDGQGNFQYLTSVLNEWGEFVTTVVVASETEDAYARMARGLVARFKRAKAPPVQVLYADNNCCK